MTTQAEINAKHAQDVADAAIVAVEPLRLPSFINIDLNGEWTICGEPENPSSPYWFVMRWQDGERIGTLTLKKGNEDKPHGFFASPAAALAAINAYRKAL
jgi:hypothetical protein